MDPNNQIPQDHSSRAPKMTFFLKLIIILLIPPLIIKIFLSLPKNTQQSSSIPSQKTAPVSITPNLTQEPIQTTSKSAPPLTQATLDDWSKKLTSGSEADFRSVVKLPKNQPLFPGALKSLSALAPFHFKLDTFKKNADNITGSIDVELGPANKKRTVLVYLQVINGTWKIVNIKM